MSGYEGRSYRMLSLLDSRGEGPDEGESGGYVRVKLQLWPDEEAILRDLILALDQLGQERQSRGLPLLALAECGARTEADVEVRTQ